MQSTRCPRSQRLRVFRRALPRARPPPPGAAPRARLLARFVDAKCNRPGARDHNDSGFSVERSLERGSRVGDQLEPGDLQSFVPSVLHRVIVNWMIYPGNRRACRVDITDLDPGLSARVCYCLVDVPDRFLKPDPQRVCRAAKTFA